VNPIELAVGSQPKQNEPSGQPERLFTESSRLLIEFARAIPANRISPTNAEKTLCGSFMGHSSYARGEPLSDAIEMGCIVPQEKWGVNHNVLIPLASTCPSLMRRVAHPCVLCKGGISECEHRKLLSFFLIAPLRCCHPTSKCATVGHPPQKPHFSQRTREMGHPPLALSGVLESRREEPKRDRHALEPWLVSDPDEIARIEAG
jgi:hypothetical protein